MQLDTPHSTAQLRQGVTPVGRSGLLDLGFVRPRSGGPTRMTVNAQAWPMRVLRPFIHDEHAALIHLHNIGGGVLSGDQMHIRMQAESGAHVIATTTSSQRIYRRRKDHLPARQTMSISISAGARFEYLPDPIIPYADSEYEQMTTWHIEGTGSMLAWDILTPGRCEYEADFSYQMFRNDLRIYHEGTPILLERYLLKPKVQTVQNLARLGSWNHLGSLVFCDGSLDESRCVALERELHTFIQERFRHELRSHSPDLTFGVSAIAAYGITIRILAHGCEPITKVCVAAREFLLQNVWGRSSSLPRKIY
jgi:urease accessory protein